MSTARRGARPPRGTARRLPEFAAQVCWGLAMADEMEPAQDADECVRQAEELRAAAAKAFDPAIAAQYLTLAAEWMRLAEARRAENTGGVDAASPEPGA